MSLPSGPGPFRNFSLSDLDIVHTNQLCSSTGTDIDDLIPSTPVGGKRKGGRIPGKPTRKQKKQAHAKLFLHSPEAIKKSAKTHRSRTTRNKALDRLRRRSQIVAPQRLIEECEVISPIASPRSPAHNKRKVVDSANNDEVKKHFTPGMSPQG